MDQSEQVIIRMPSDKGYLMPFKDVHPKVNVELIYTKIVVRFF